VDPRDALTHAIRQRIRAGTLPKQDCRMTWYGPGRQSLCKACDQPVRPEDVEVECDLPTGGTIIFHQSCYEVWSHEWPNM
jgi:hypothetical protein